MPGWNSTGAGSVHPRASGERASNRMRNGMGDGSSPRERGTPRICFRPSHRLRFIPARAGNACRPAGLRSGASVHPRASGERQARNAGSMFRNGSSPRERGTPCAEAGPGILVRFIPARAGNARSAVRGRRAYPVHPRASGERSTEPGETCHEAGSSPRERGTRGLADLAQVRRRFIPARAGNAFRAVCRAGSCPVHPRASGERYP